MSDPSPTSPKDVRRDAADRAEVLEASAAGLAHELRQPLGAIANYADLCTLLVERGPDDNRQKLLDALEAIKQEVDRAGRVVRDATEQVKHQDDVPRA